MPNEDRPNILAPPQPPGTFAHLRTCQTTQLYSAIPETGAKAFADRERKAKEEEEEEEEEEEAKKNNGQQNGEEQTKESSSSSASAPESKPRVHPSLLKPRPVFPGTMNIAILNDDWTLPLDQVDLKARRQREVYLAREIAAWEQFQYDQQQQGRRQASEDAAESKGIR
ncbi:hypothetical protein CGCTS75_v005216 [Colletotrichum tropicale]|nr:hypothetical protein CGCTS75_v005216 [Colletotrichum tropicale]